MLSSRPDLFVPKFSVRVERLEEVCGEDIEIFARRIVHHERDRDFRIS
jgi:hypothetical protein